MKKKYLLTYSIFLGFLISCNSEKRQFAVVELDLSNISAENLHITGEDDFKYNRKFESGTDTIKFIDTLRIDQEGYFRVSLKRQGFLLYLEKGAHLKITADADDVINSINFSGNLDGENNYLIGKEKLKRTDIYKLPDMEFAQELALYKEELLNFLKESDVSEDFRQQEQKEIEYDITSIRLLYPSIHTRLTGKQDLDLPDDFYASLDEINFTDTIAYMASQTNGYPIMVFQYFEKLAKDKKANYSNNELIAYLKEVDKAFPNGPVKDDLFRPKIGMGMPMNNTIDGIYQTYKGALQDKDYLEMVEKEYRQLKRLSSGNPAPAFELENFHGGVLHLEDLKGKPVYLDIWATWCGPCIEEFPSLRILAKEFPDIQFVSISIDQRRHFETWRKIVYEEDLPGIQLIAYNENVEFKDNYAIRSLPRYVLIDKDGNIVSANVFRPSDPQLISLFEELL